MDQAFEKLKKDGHATVDSLMKRFKDAKLLDYAKDAESKTKEMLANAADKTNVELSKFKEVVTKLAEENKKTADQVVSSLVADLQGAAASAAGAVKAQIIEDTEDAKNKAKKLFDKVRDKADVELDKFEEVVTKLAEENEQSLDQVRVMLLEAIPKLQEAIIAGTNAAATAAVDALNK